MQNFSTNRGLTSSRILFPLHVPYFHRWRVYICMYERQFTYQLCFFVVDIIFPFFSINYFCGVARGAFRSFKMLENTLKHFEFNHRSDPRSS